MKKMKRSTWIAILCVLLAIAASQIYGTIGTEKAENESVTKVTEITPVITEAPKEKTKASTEGSLSPVPKTPVTEIKTEPETAQQEISRPVSAPANTVSAQAPEPISFSLPTTGETGTAYSDKELIYFSTLKEWRCHLGTDFLPAENDAVFAAADGKVEKIYEDHLFGTTVLIAHQDGYKTYYSSLSEVMTEEGAEIRSGQEIGRMGQTALAEEGVHLHFALEKDGKLINPIGA